MLELGHQSWKTDNLIFLPLYEWLGARPWENGTEITVDQEGIPQTSFRPVPVLLLQAAPWWKSTEHVLPVSPGLNTSSHFDYSWLLSFWMQEG